MIIGRCIMNIKGANIYIDKGQGEILLNSNTIYETPQYDWFLNFIKNKENPYITKEDFQNFSPEQQNLLDGVLYDELYKNSSDEWKEYDYKEFNNINERPICSLCGERIKKVYYIQNKKNKKIFTVGSTCIDTYKDLQGKDGKNLNEIKKNTRMHSKKLNLNSKSYGIIDKIENWNKYIDGLPIYIPKKLADEYNRIYFDLSNLYLNYLKVSNQDKSEQLSEQIISLVYKGDILKS